MNVKMNCLFAGNIFHNCETKTKYINHLFNMGGKRSKICQEEHDLNCIFMFQVYYITWLSDISAWTLLILTVFFCFESKQSSAEDR